MSQTSHASIESRRSWQMVILTVIILSVAFGAPLLVVVGLRTIQATLGSDRSVVSFASALVWIGNALGGVAMGRLADRIGAARVALIGTLAIAAGLALTSLGSVWAIYVGHGVLIGFFGLGALYAPLAIYISYWFDRRRGTALALVASGQYVAGVLWPAAIEQSMARLGWQTTMLCSAACVLAVMPLVFFLRDPPALPSRSPLLPTPATSPRDTQPLGIADGLVLGLPPNVVQSLLCFAGFFCCVPMALPSSHLVAFCGDLDIPPAHGAAMLSLMLACAFVARQFWGWVADRIGGLRTILAGSVAQMVTLAGFLMTRDETALFAVTAAFGLGFAGLIPSYWVAIRELFPPRDASWRIPTVLLCLMSGMAFGTWFGGALYDLFLSYRIAFIAGVGFNAINMLVILFLVLRRHGRAVMIGAAA